MRWLVGAALLPMLVCGLLMMGGMALAALGMRRRAVRWHVSESPRDDERVTSGW